MMQDNDSGSDQQVLPAVLVQTDAANLSVNTALDSCSKTI